MRWARVPLVAITLLGLVAGSAAADEVDDLSALLTTKPAGMDRAEWKEARRDAAKKLGKLGDKRAVPALIKVVETETFDVVAEHAITALGKLGDKRAVPVLKSVVADSSRDRFARGLAKKALRKLGDSRPPERRGDDDDDDDSAGAGVSSGGDSIASGTEVRVSDGPAFGDDVIAASEVLELAAGNAELIFDSARDVASLQGDVAARYRREVEKDTIGYGYGGRGRVFGGLLDPPGGDTASEALVFSASAGADGRFYMAGRQLYAAVEGALGMSITGLKIERAGGNITRELLASADVQAGLGLGYGRILDVGAGLRLRRLEIALEKSRALGRPITPDLAARIMRSWWALRGEQGLHDRLVATVKILREAGVLLGEPDASTSYRLLEVLRDGQLDHRLDGYDVRVSVTETYRARDPIVPVPDGRVEALVLRARYGMQSSSTVHELIGESYGRLRLLTADGDPAPWTLGAAAAWRRYVYGEHFDPIGAIELRAEAGVSSNGAEMDPLRASRISGGIGWLWSPSRASRYRLAANATLETGEFFLGASFEATYGFLDVGYVGGAAYSGLK